LIEVTIPLSSHEEAILVLGPYDRHAKLLRQELEIEIFTRNGNLRLKGSETAVAEARRRVEHLLGKLRKGREVDLREAEGILAGPPVAAEPQTRGMRNDKITERGYAAPGYVAPAGFAGARPARAGTRPANVGHYHVRPFEPRGERQRRYVESIEKRTLTFGLGVAGTGKTFLAVGAALRALQRGEVRRLIVSRPVVEAGEKLGFLPGDLAAKLNPYVRPVYDALSELIDFEDVLRLEEAGVIEIAPLAYMRGRTLSQAFVILDEAQNTTVPQMKMFLTRLGEGSRMVVTGDPSQVDLEYHQKSGLADAVGRLQGFQDVGVTEFGVADICRHPLVEQIVRAYESPPRGTLPAPAAGAGPAPEGQSGERSRRRSNGDG
jgi:phosphate starvation-inducible protein PhoH and related proteins